MVTNSSLLRKEVLFLKELGTMKCLDNGINVRIFSIKRIRLQELGCGGVRRENQGL